MRHHEEQWPQTMLRGMNNRTTPEDRAAKIIREAEASRARIFQTPGKDMNFLTSQFAHSSLVDESFLLVAAHVDESTKIKIAAGEYVNFSKLLPRDKILVEEETHLQMVYKNGHTYWVPEADSFAVVINNFSKWEQAFRVFSDVYCKAHPERSWELIQYNHIIHTASLTYFWENVYMTKISEYI